MLNCATIGLLTGLGVQLTPKLGYFEYCACEVWMFVYGKSTNNIVLEDALTPKPGPRMYSVLLRWTPSLKGQCHKKSLRLWGGRLGTKDVSDPYFIV